MTATPKQVAAAPQPSRADAAQKRTMVAAAAAPVNSAVSLLQAVPVAQRVTMNGTICRLPVFDQCAPAS